MTPTNPVTLLRSVSAYVLHEKAQIQRLIIDQKYTFWCHKVEIKPLNFACFHKNTNILRFIIDQKHTFWCHKLKIKPLNFSLFAKKKLVTPTNPVVQDRYKVRLNKTAFFSANVKVEIFINRSISIDIDRSLYCFP